MTTKIELLWKQALKTFTSRRTVGYKLCTKNFDKLRSLIEKLQAEDVKLDDGLLEYVKTQPAPMCVIDVFANQDLNIAIFILKNGIRMPLHDHPGMHGLLKVLTGKVKIDSYTLTGEENQRFRLNDQIPGIKHPTISVDVNSPACVLDPVEKNLHEISCIQGPAAFLDVLSPPYDADNFGRGTRPCTYFKSNPTDLENVQLIVSDSPANFYSQSLKYRGPPLTL